MNTTLHLPPEMQERGVSIFSGLRTLAGVQIAQAFLAAFAAEPLQTPASEIFGAPAEDRTYYDRINAAKLKQRAAVAQEVSLHDDGGPITPAKTLLIADLMQMHEAIHDAAGHIRALMPDAYKSDESAVEDFGSVSQARNFGALDAYKHTGEYLVDGLNPTGSLARIEAMLQDRPVGCAAVTTTELAERFLAAPLKLIAALVEINQFVRESNEATRSTFAQFYSPKEVAKQQEAEAKRIANYMIANAAVRSRK